ncbi:MAG: Cas10/Cmr2 second palm domain-containing protein [Candidatus Freyarchaeota archaeon]
MAFSTLLVDPITFRVERRKSPDLWKDFTNAFLRKVVSSVKDSLSGKRAVEKLGEINNLLVELLSSDDCEWASIPSDTGFPGFFSSMADHALSASALGVAIALELYNKGVDLSGEYGGELAGLLASRDGLIEVVRTMCLLHDSGKPSPYPAEKTRETVFKFLNDLGLRGLASEVAESASRHEPGGTLSPRTRLEWVVALASMLAEQDMVFTGDILSVACQPLRWLAERVEPSEGEKIERLVSVVEGLGGDVLARDSDEWVKLRDILPLDYAHLKSTRKELARAGELLGADVRLALILFEGAGIQGYVTKSSSARHLAGRGSLVEVATRLAKKELEKRLAPESIIYVTSGSVFALVPPSELEEIVDAVNKRFRGLVEGGMSLKSCKSREETSFDLFEIKAGPAYAWHEWETASTLQRIGRRNFGEFYTIMNNAIHVLDEPSEEELRVPAGEVCSICFEEKAIPEDDKRISEMRRRLPEDEREGYKAGHVCLRVDQHRMNLRENIPEFLKIEFKDKASVFIPIRREPSEEVENSPAYRIAKRVATLLRKSLKDEHSDLTAKLAGKTVIFQTPESWNMLGRQSRYALEGKVPTDAEEEEVHDLAFIRGDGDNFGLLKSSMTNLALYRKVSNMFVDVIQNSIAKALSEVIVHQLKLYTEHENLPESFNLELPFDVVYYGGDDFLLVLDAGFLFVFLNAFRESVLNSLGPRRRSYDKGAKENLSIFPLGISLGVVVAPNRAPIHGTLSALKTLEDKAKRFSKSRQRAADGSFLFGGEISVAVERFTTIPTKEFVEESYKPVSLGGATEIYHTSWPLLGSHIFSSGASGKQSLLGLVKELLENGVRSNNVAEFVSLESLSEAEVALRIKFKAARLDEDRPEREAYKTLAKNLTVKEGNSVKFRHWDVAKVMKIIHDNSLLLP